MHHYELELHSNGVVTPCPQCLNNTKFRVTAEPTSDGGREISLICICGLDPTHSMPQYRHHAGPGEPEELGVEQSLACWNQAVKEDRHCLSRLQRPSIRSYTSPEVMILEREQDFLATALQEKHGEEGKASSYLDCLEELIHMAKTQPDRFIAILPQLRDRLEKPVTFD
ncbi:hypothetical protein [Pseudomonas putida]|uniref:Uncharacterized protein n=1 Tax=Pseudomonas putida TaxID=303 RepID=A0A8I1EB15_PSEPU|nr:hypothetical protein [Pseudomonas putida]MBI6882455.1 hypothetical protein [Pseudomonas putida]